MNVIVIDCGNAILKAKTASREETLPHALKQLTETEYQNILTRAGKAGAPADYIRVNGTPYVVGESAERHGTLTRRTGAARYTRDYYGVFTAAMLARLYERGGNVAVFGSHPPGDVAYRDDLMQAAFQRWEVDSAGRALVFDVVYTNTFDEPLGGLMNVILAPDGKHYQRSDINGGRALVIDIGGHTVDWLAVAAGGEVDYSLQESTPIGILNVLRDFGQSFKTAHKDLFKGVSTLPAARVRAALRTGVYHGGGREIPCEAEASEAVSVLVNRILDTYQTTASNGADFDTVLLTGGGSGLLYERLAQGLNHPRIVLAEAFDTIHLANVRGGLKYWRLLEALDLLDV